MRIIFISLVLAFSLALLAFQSFVPAQAFTMAATNKIRRWYPLPNTGAPSARSSITRPTVWTGTEVMFFGGSDGTVALNTGYRYNPSTKVWTQMNPTGAPTKRNTFYGVWTGTYYIVWGGQNELNNRLNDGARYNPTTDTWLPINATGAPSTRSQHTSVWTGSKMIVWGGFGAGLRGDGAIYDPTADTWSPIQTTNAPEARQVHTVVWTGSKMILWGGYGASASLNNGAIYDPSNNTWTATSTTGAPIGRNNHCAVWTGSKMIVWGGRNHTNATYYNTGGVYDPATNTWTTMTTTNAPPARICVNGVFAWDGARFIIWGGADGAGVRGEGGMYNPASDTWKTITSQGMLGARSSFAAIWMGTKLFLWGGVNGSTYYNNGAFLY